MRVLLLLAKSKRSSTIANAFGIAENTVRNIGRRFVEGGIERAINDLPRPGKQRVLTISQANHVIAMACSKPPAGAHRWTIELITKHAIKHKIVKSIGRETVRILLKTHDLKPWREKMWTIARLNKEFVTAMEDVLNVYQRPYNPKEPVVCFDEKTLQILQDVRVPLPMKPGKIARRDSEYVRNGTANVFCAVEPKAGRHFTVPTKNRKAPKCAKMLRRIAESYPRAKVIHLVMDNLNTHREKSLVDLFGMKEGHRIWKRFSVHYTPKHGSWLNQGEIEISMYSRQCLGKDRLGDYRSLVKRTRAWNRRANRSRTQIHWRFTTKDARKKFNYKTQKSYG